jgi:anaerobic magnesium-protoporphyrin IX monomethyl ester cyclase
MRKFYLVNPPERRGYSNERSLSGGLGVSRKLKFWEKPQLLLPPPDIMLTAAVAEQCGVAVEIVDLILDRYEGEQAVMYTVERITGKTEDARYKAQDTREEDLGQNQEIWVGIRLSMPTLPQDLEFANRLKARMPQVRMFLFGSVIMTTLDHWVAETNADALLFGEPEAVVGPMLQAEGDKWKCQPGIILPGQYVPVKGLALYDGSQQRKFKNWVQVDALADLPRPAYHLLPMERYSPTGKLEDIGVYVTASRGCPIGCTMCPYMLHEGRPIRNSSVDRVVDEMEWLNKTWGIYRWRFRDPNFGFDRKQVRAILNESILRGIKMEATVEGSLECMDDDLIELMIRAGVKTITTGIETADEACLKSIGQKIKINDILARKIDFADKLGLHVYGTFVIGAPEESWDTVRRTINYALNVPCESGFTVMTPFPGTPMYYRALAEGLLEQGMTYEKWNSYEATVRSRCLTADDLSLARLWARLELIIPYRVFRARKLGQKAVLKTQVALLPRRAALQVVRARVAWRRWRGAPVVQVPAELVGRNIDKIPLSLRSE